MFNTTVRQGPSERYAEACFFVVEALSDTKTKLAGFFNILPRRNL